MRSMLFAAVAAAGLGVSALGLAGCTTSNEVLHVGDGTVVTSYEVTPGQAIADSGAARYCADLGLVAVKTMDEPYSRVSNFLDHRKATYVCKTAAMAAEMQK